MPYAETAKNSNRPKWESNKLKHTLKREYSFNEIPKNDTFIVDIYNKIRGKLEVREREREREKI